MLLYSQGEIGDQSFMLSKSSRLSLCVKSFYLLLLLIFSFPAFSSTSPPDDGLDWAVVDISGDGDFNTIEAALAAEASNIFIRNGTYTISTSLRITKEDSNFLGESKEGVVIETAEGVCADMLHIDADGVTVSSITVRQTLTCPWTAIVSGGRSNITLKDSIVYGSDSMFAIFFAGPEHAAGQEPLDLVENNQLDENNRVLNNEIYSNATGDVLSFSLQKNGLVSGNTLHGGLIAVFLDRDVVVENNTLNDPNSFGIFLSLPSYNVTIRNNVINNSVSSGIKVALQVDHNDADGNSLTLPTHRSKDINITGNTITNARNNALEINNLVDSAITHNTINTPDFSGIYAFRTERLYVAHNTITDAGMVAAGRRTSQYDWSTIWDSGIYFDQYVADSLVSSNTIKSNGHEMQRGIAINPHWPGNTGNRISWNRLLGDYLYETVHSGATGNNTENDNFLVERTGQDLWLEVGIGQGKITTGGLECSSSCQVPSNTLEAHTFTAKPADGYYFAGWISPASCVGNGTTGCAVSNNNALDVVAWFTTTAPAVPLVPLKVDQEISFTAPATQTYSVNGSFEIAATSTSNLPVTLSSDDTAVCTVAEGVVSIISAGRCDITATQLGDENYLAATDVNESIYITNLSGLSLDTDTNNSGVGSVLEQTFGSEDSDQDGIPNQLENLAGQDINSYTDTDNDGSPDVIEIISGRDPLANDNDAVGAPSISAPALKALLPKGLLSIYSQAEFGVSAADEGVDLTPQAYAASGACEDAVPYNYAAVCSPLASAGLVAGTHKFWWLVTDNEGHWGVAKQQLVILSEVGFSSDLLLSGEPSQGSVSTQLVLSGTSINTEEFSIPFSLSGSAINPTDHDLVAGEFVIKPEATGSEPILITLGDAPVNGAEIIITLDTSAAVFAEASSVDIDSSQQFVVPAGKTTQIISISQDISQPPRLSSLSGTQGEAPNQIQGTTFDKSLSSLVTIAFESVDTDGGDYLYDWTSSDSRLVVAMNDAAIASPTIDINQLEAGKYYVEVHVTDQTHSVSQAVVLGSMLTVSDGIVLSSTLDSDGDGVPDAEEGFGDSDGDGQANYLDGQDTLSSVLPATSNDYQNFLVKTTPGLKIISGATAASNSGGAKITTEELSEGGDKGQPVNDAELLNVTLEHIFDYEVENVEVPEDPFAAGKSVQIVLPLNTALTIESTFFKYDAANGWRDFTLDESNMIQWAVWQADVEGSCPDAGSAVYSNDVTAKAGANCLQITIQDGGANDADGVVDGRIVDPLGVGAETVAVQMSATAQSGGGSIALKDFLFAILILCCLFCSRKEKNKQHSIRAS